MQWLQTLLNRVTKLPAKRIIVDGVLGPRTLELAVKKKIWTCQDGRVIAIESMDDRHVLNCARMLMRSQRQDRDVMLRVFEYETNLRGRLL